MKYCVQLLLNIRLALLFATSLVYIIYYKKITLDNDPTSRHFALVVGKTLLINVCQTSNDSHRRETERLSFSLNQHFKI